MENTAIILGSPRSGTTLLAKLIDSHPDVLYRHEPDVSNACNLPFHPEKEQVEQYVNETKTYLDKLVNAKDLRTAFKLPLFNKNYRRTASRYLIYSIGFILRVIEKIIGKRIKANIIPDLNKSNTRNNITTLIKSVDSLGRAYLINKASPETKIIYIIRHPCGIIALQLRGIQKGIMGKEMYLNALFNIEVKKNFPYTLEDIKSKTIEGQIAFKWMILNEKIYGEMKDNPTLKIVRYEDLCTNTINEVKDIFTFIGLEWNDQTADFINQIENSGNEHSSYFSVFRSPSKSVYQWKEELNDVQVERVNRIIVNSEIGKFYSS